MHAVWHSAMSYCCVPRQLVHSTSMFSPLGTEEATVATNVFRKMNTCIADVSCPCRHQC